MRVLLIDRVMRFYLIPIFVFGGIFGLSSQVFINKVKVLGGSGDDYAVKIAQLSGGDFVIMGYSDSNDGDVEGSHTVIPGKGDIWCIKVDTNFNVLWKKCIGGIDYDFPIHVVETIGGDIYISARTNSNDGDINCHSDSFYNEPIIIKMNGQGNIEWQKCFGLPNCTNSSVLYSLLNQNIVMISESNDSLVTGYKGELDIRITKLDTNGNILCERSYGGTNSESSPKCALNNDGSIVVFCRTYSNDGDIADSNTVGDFGNVWVFKIGINGDIIWQNKFGGLISSNIPQTIERTSDGGFVLTNYECNENNNKAEIIKLDQNGNVEWDKCIGGNNGAQPYCFKETQPGNYIGLFVTGSPELTNYHGGKDAWIVKFDSQGEIIWDKCFGSSKYDQFSDFIKVGSGNYICVGETSFNDGDNLGQVDYTGSDLWLAEISENTTATENLSTQQTFQLYPNPASNTCSIKSFDHSFQQLHLFDMTGRMVREWKDATPVQQKTIDLDGLQSGIYIIKIFGESGIYAHKFMVEH